ncbi:MAG TPA: DUF2309 family protein, partial [Chromatiaceae bacterium]|nr:DUF2309 family protein [Chromatiaceae bacterium]
LELPGWSGQVAWRSGRPGYHGEGHPIDLTDYLAVRLVMERIFALRLVAPMWRIEPGLDMLRWYLRHNPAEFLVRHATFNEELPEYLASRSQRLVEQASAEPLPAEQWLRLAELIHIWRQSVLRESGSGHTVSGSAWPLFRLAQHLGLGATALRAAGEKGARALLETLGRLDEEQAGYLRLLAYERRYREEALRALALNHGRGRWRTRPERPLAQVMTCMDDREEGLRRYLEELEPRIETLGAAGYFNLTMDWRGLDEKRVALCPATQVPVNEIVERPREDQQSLGELRSKRLKLRRRVLDLVLQESRRGVLSAAGLIALAAPGAALSLAGKAMVPGSWGRFVRRLRERWEPPVATRIRVNGVEGGSEPTPEHPREGFTREEQIHRVSAFLRRNGFTRDFAPLVVMMGHGSQSQNNPHLAAYGCGACSGRFSGPNGRTFAAIVNQPEVRAELLQQGIDIPPDTWFIGAEHNTCDDSIAWYDLDLIPDVLREPFKALRQVMEEACRLHAAERSRRFASAPRQMTPEQALAHVRARMHDFSQVRPELGHACVALGVVGRRAVTRGLFLDRRAFLISYDPSQDAQGELLEEVLLEVAPVGAGIALEYYFSSVDNENHGCGSKVTHNVTGLFAVMEGSASDLRTGLPKQMIEIHEPMRLLLVVEAAPEVI